MQTFTTIARLDDILDQADAFLLDQFGTLHDGISMYPGVAAAMARLRLAGKRIVILSNSGKRAAPNMARIARLGLPPESYDAFLTSGEVAWRLLAEGRLPALSGVRRCLVLSRGEDREALAGLALERTEDAAEADLILLLGSEADRIGLDAYSARLAPAARRGIPCLCGNPDRLMVLGDGQLAPAPGRVAELYAEMGGEVMWIGKPEPAIYTAAFALLAPWLGDGLDRGRIWAVGDSLEHDAAGAAAQGCRSLLVRTGIMAGRSSTELEAEMARCGLVPDAVIAAFA
ncbi:MAG TPA: TIGR01459 family HAD-type hydrolase [Acidisoma sp.]|jgi:HAD superfamily hydrolase (TIGR01459 family)|uniref:TIGR01459 family HAD-type hydrolase n=1 Tax=Acidisoma sp. TaxID=1872115 RepID=UPI002BD3C88B|nr:TIGR01459 family HAD-type hydrolase [Acidisoma sp.]HTH99862.1 TIGR01459 family HAD-type hydrolase [Acidisoma sp.]